jgi:Uma2 family endonuclease
MTPKRIPFPFKTLDDLLVGLGGIPLDRVWLNPAPGTATVRDVGYVVDRHTRQVELIDGTLVEKATSLRAGFLASELVHRISSWNDVVGNRGITLGASAPVKLAKGVVRIPSVSFVNWDRIPNRVIPDESVATITPNLAVDFFNAENTRAEMERKLKEYFLSEVQLVWYADPRKRTVQVYTSPDDVTELGENDTLDGGDVLPGFSVPVASLFEQLASPPASKAKTPKPNGGKKPKKRK